MERPKHKWCRETIAHIRFKPDRERVWDELIAHIEDRCEALQSRGVPEEEAEIRAVAAMGDPEEVGKQLDAVHKPWLGRLWIVSKVLVILTLIAAMFFVPNAVAKYRDALNTEQDERYSAAYWARDAVCQSVYRANQTNEIDGYNFTLEEVSWWRGEGDIKLIIDMSVKRPLFKPELTSGVMERFYITDDQGNRKVANVYDDDYDPNIGLYTRNTLYDAALATKPLTGRCMIVFGAYFWDPEWVELSFDHGGQTFTFRFPGPGR